MSVFSSEELEALLVIKEMEQRPVLFKLLDTVVADKARAVLSAPLSDGSDEIVQRKAAYDGVRSAINEIKKQIESAGKPQRRVRKPRA